MGKKSKEDEGAEGDGHGRETGIGLFKVRASQYVMHYSRTDVFLASIIRDQLVPYW